MRPRAFANTAVFGGPCARGYRGEKTDACDPCVDGRLRRRKDDTNEGTRVKPGHGCSLLQLRRHLSRPLTRGACRRDHGTGCHTFALGHASAQHEWNRCGSAGHPDPATPCTGLVVEIWYHQESDCAGGVQAGRKGTALTWPASTGRTCQCANGGLGGIFARAGGCTWSGEH